MVSEIRALPCNEANVDNCLPTTSKLAEVGVSAIRKGPKWHPAILNELLLRSYHKIPVTFVRFNEY